MISSLSFFMSVFWSCVIILIVHFLRKKPFFLNGFGMSTVVQLYLFCIIRMLVVLEFPFTRTVELSALYNTFFRAIWLEIHTFGRFMFTIFDLFLLIWWGTAAVRILLYISRYLHSVRMIRKLSYIVDDRAEKLLQEIGEENKSRIPIRVVRCAAVELPMGIGLLNKRILLPAVEYTEDEERYILMHEYMHFQNHDLWAKVLIEIFCRIYWWNPLVYLLKSDVEQMLELKCDLHVTSGLNAQKRAAYLRTITTCLARSGSRKTDFSAVSTQFFKWKAPNIELIERFKLVAYPVSANSRKFQLLSIGFFALVLVVSYLFVLQPRYEPMEKAGVVYFDGIRLSGYIVKHWDNRYTLYNDDGQLIPLNEEAVLVLEKKGFEIIER